MVMRAVHRAVSELRRGTPVLLRGPEGALVIAVAETVGNDGLRELAAAALAPPVLLLAPVRVAAVLSRPVPLSAPEEGVAAIRLPQALMAPDRLRMLADPTIELLLPEVPERAAVPPLGANALLLAKIGRLLPVLIAAPARDVPALSMVQAAEVQSYPPMAATTLHPVAEARVPLEDVPEARIIAFRAADGGIEHLAILVGEPERFAAEGGAPLARVHSECFTGDLLGSLRCDCGPQLRGALKKMAEDGHGALLYLAQEGRGIGLVNKLRAYALQDTGLDTLDANRALGYGADERNFMVAAEMLRQLGIPRVRLLTNNPDKLASLAACGIEVVGREVHSFDGNGVNDGYLATKAARFGHMLG
ncbi:MAG: GTP cyclohydrolase II [Alphaproteobacteria bacterium]|nr:GTP cyclohydrolase II [Alphaproteobacteria bacterium]